MLVMALFVCKTKLTTALEVLLCHIAVYGEVVLAKYDKLALQTEQEDVYCA